MHGRALFVLFAAVPVGNASLATSVAVVGGVGFGKGSAVRDMQGALGSDVGWSLFLMNGVGCDGQVSAFRVLLLYAPE